MLPAILCFVIAMLLAIGFAVCLCKMASRADREFPVDPPLEHIAVERDRLPRPVEIMRKQSNT